MIELAADDLKTFGGLRSNCRGIHVTPSYIKR